MGDTAVRNTLSLFMLAMLTCSALAAQQPAPAYPTPQGTPTENGLAGFAKILCSAVFVSGRDPAEAARISAYFFLPRDEQDKAAWSIGRDRKTASASFGGTTRAVRLYGDQGCIIQNPARPGIDFTPVPVKTALPDATSLEWPRCATMQPEPGGSR
jgi:hypothetical protein